MTPPSTGTSTVTITISFITIFSALIEQKLQKQ